METGVIVVTVMVGLFGVTSAVLGFKAGAEKLTPNDIQLSNSLCVYTDNSASMLGVWAIILLAVARIIAWAAGGCCGSSRLGGGASKSTRRLVGVVVSVLSWMSAVIAGVCYWQGVASREPGRTRDATSTDPFATEYERCYYDLKGGIFKRAAVLSPVATSLGILSCILLHDPAATVAGAAEPKPDGQHPPGDGVVVGLPLWSAQGYGQQPYPQPAQGYGQAPNSKFAPPPV
ncbi:hypothetical protein BAE44_0012935 [Dichanthelium oligosanthes]|uniref:Uncharacterized protein n=1 Tax=Dichanthelium oligosanthes TaxID=888268 RepID=A0A1E5VLP2_9POAL|nr:hypothetical protein BAE44_0012935 [Dichanthelium oligosanthes]